MTPFGTWLAEISLALGCRRLPQAVAKLDAQSIADTVIPVVARGPLRPSPAITAERPDSLCK